MMARMRTIGEYMTTDPVTLSESTEISGAAAFLMKSGVSGAPVLNALGELSGLLTKKDCFKAVLNGAYYREWGGTVADYMTRDLHTLDPDLDIVSAAEIFLGTPYRRFPVVKEGRLLGILSRSDLLRAFIEVGFGPA